MDEIKASDLFICHVCGAKFNNKAHVNQHIRKSHPSQLFQCDLCPKTFNVRWKLKRHKLIHSGQEPFQCQYCPKKYVTFSEWRLHVKSHTDNKLHMCHICSKQFKYKHHLSKHVNAVHLDIRNYMCGVCGAAFHSKNKLQCHSIIHSGEKPFKCQFCSKQCTQASNLKTHILGVHKDLSHLVYNKDTTQESLGVDPKSIVVPTSYKDYIKTIKGEETNEKSNEIINKRLKRRLYDDDAECLQETGEVVSSIIVRNNRKKNIIKHNRKTKTKIKNGKTMDNNEIKVDIPKLKIEIPEENVKLEPLSPKHESTSDVNCEIKCELTCLDKNITENGCDELECFKIEHKTNGIIKSDLDTTNERDVNSTERQETIPTDSQKLYSCKMCDKRFTSTSGLSRHMINFHKMCTKCDKVFESDKDSRQHCDKYCCKYCTQVFDTRKEFAKHKNTHRAKRKCKTKSSVISDTSCYCDACGMKISNRRNLIKHISLMHSSTTYKCDQCPKTYPVEWKLNNHKLIHSGTEPFKCILCPKKFVSYGSLKIHMICHNNTKNYKCETCSKLFKLKNHLRKHVNTVHLNIRKYVCDICGATFSSNHHLKRHTMSHTGDKPFKCKFCDKQCTQASNLKIHVLGVHRDVSHLVYKKEELKTSSQIDANSTVIPKFSKDYLKIITAGDTNYASSCISTDTQEDGHQAYD